MTSDPTKAVAIVITTASTILRCGEAVAFRPFDGTDAAVVKPNNIEVELGPIEYVREADERWLTAPNVRLNYGFAEGWEAVLEGQTTHGSTIWRWMSGRAAVGSTTVPWQKSGPG